MAKSQSREMVRVIALGVAGVIFEIGLIIADKKHAFDNVPNWLEGLFFIVPIVIYLWWLATHDPVKNRLRLVYNRRPKALLLILITVGCLVGGALGTLEWWIVSKSDIPVPVLVEKSVVKLFLSETAMLEMGEIKFDNLDDTPAATAKALKDVIAKRGIPQMALRPKQTSVPTNIVLRNIGNEKLTNLQMTVTATSNIVGLTEGAKQAFPNQVVWNVDQLRPYNNLGVENFFTLSVAISHPPEKVGFIVTLEGDNLKRFAATGALLYKVPEPGENVIKPWYFPSPSPSPSARAETSDTTNGAQTPVPESESQNSKSEWNKIQQINQIAGGLENLRNDGSTKVSEMIQRSDFKGAIQVYNYWVERCSAALGKADEEMPRFNRRTSYRSEWETAGHKWQLPVPDGEESKNNFLHHLKVALNDLSRIAREISNVR